jgi:hypothetical protein
VSVVIDRSNMLHTIECLVVENGKREKALCRFIAWFDLYSRDWSDEYCSSHEFFDLRDVYDAAKAMLKGAA